MLPAVGQVGAVSCAYESGPCLPIPPDCFSPAGVASFFMVLPAERQRLNFGGLYGGDE